MSAQENKAIYLRVVEGLNRGDLESSLRFTAPHARRSTANRWGARATGTARRCLRRPSPTGATTYWRLLARGHPRGGHPGGAPEDDGHPPGGLGRTHHDHTGHRQEHRHLGYEHVPHPRRHGRGGMVGVRHDGVPGAVGRAPTAGAARGGEPRLAEPIAPASHPKPPE